jgi:hypothetical protein
MLIGGIVVLVLLVGGAFFLFGGSGDDGGGDDPTTTTVDTEAQELEEAQQAADDAFGELPPALQAACELNDVEDNDEGVVASISCEPSDGADDIQITVFEDEDDVGDAFGETEDRADEPLDEAGDCEVDRYASQAYASEDDPESIVGQVACYLTDGNAEIVWTVDDQSLIAVASRGDDGDAALYRWWAELVDVAPTDDSDDFPNTEESSLLTHVPSDFRDTCTRAELRPREIASVRCTPSEGASVVFYNQYPSAQGATAEYETLRSLNNVSRNTGNNNECPFEGSLTIDDESRGRVFCANSENGELLVWSNRELAIQTEATIADGATVAEFWEWWTGAGPS